MDKHYTPGQFARSIVRQLACNEPTTAADFAAGQGALLEAIADRWPNCGLTATDLDGDAVRALKRRFANLSAATCDFLNPMSHRVTPVLRRAYGRTSLIFLNPPFSCPGGTKQTVLYEGRTMKCSRAMAFLMAALPYLNKSGRAIALLPTSCLTSEKDSVALRELTGRYAFEILAEAEQVRFGGCNIEVSVVCLSNKILRQAGLPPEATRPEQTAVILYGTGTIHAELFRGTMSMPSIATSIRNGVPLVHTTNLRFGRVEFDDARLVAGNSTVIGPTVLIPRVGRPRATKICLYFGFNEIALSDCVISIKGQTAESTLKLFQVIKEINEMFMATYCGSCAKYITMRRLQELLKSMGIKVSVRKTRTAKVGRFIEGRTVRLTATPAGRKVIARTFKTVGSHSDGQ